MAVLGALASSLLSGCSWLPKRPVPLDARTGFYQSASLTYRLDAGQLQQPLDVARVEHQAVSYEQVASSPLPDQSIGTLEVTFPHPSGRPGVALVKFTLESKPTKAQAAAKSWNPFKKKPTGPQPVTTLTTSQPEVYEAWALDIASAESDQLFKLLANDGFYQNERPGAVGASLSVKINGTEAQKNWNQLPELNALVQRVRREGQLVAYSRPAGLTGAAISSTQAYDNLQAQIHSRNTSAAPPNAPISAFSMAPIGAPSLVAGRPATAPPEAVSPQFR